MAYRLMSADVHIFAEMLFRLSNPLWDWYTEEVTKTRSPKDGVRYSMRFAAGGWKNAGHVRKLVAVLYGHGDLVYIGFADE